MRVRISNNTAAVALRNNYSMMYLHDIAKKWARAFNSDGFAFNRAMHEMLHGYAAPSDVLATAEAILTARGEANER